MLDIDKALKTAVRTGKVSLGSRVVLDAARAGRARLILVASNCPENVLSIVQHYAGMSNIPVHSYAGSKLDLGIACGKPFGVSAVAIRDPGDSDILSLVEGQDVK